MTLTQMQALTLLAQVPDKLPGRIEGGWEYVWAAHILTWVALTLYALVLWRRRRIQESSKEP